VITRTLYAILAVATIPAVIMLSNLFWQGLREARGIVMVQRSTESLQRILTSELLNAPPEDVARFAEPLAGGYALNMRLFRQADQEAHRRGRVILRPTLAVLVLGSGLVGFLSVGWLGVALPLVNLFIVHTTFVGSTRGSVDDETISRAAQHVQIVAVILHRWYQQNPQEVEEWLQDKPQLGPMWHRVRSLHHLANMILFEKADADRVAIVQNPCLPDRSLLGVVDKHKLVKVLEELDSHTVYKPNYIATLLVGCGLPAVVSDDASAVAIGGYRLESVKPEWGDPGISALTVLSCAYRLILQTEPESQMIGRGFWFRDVLGRLKAELRMGSPSV
jgi:hypothetical protein